MFNVGGLFEDYSFYGVIYFSKKKGKADFN